jgi:hypothetical protein
MQARTPCAKAFWFFFSKKNILKPSTAYAEPKAWQKAQPDPPPDQSPEWA